MDLYHQGSRQLQDQCDTRRLADRIDEQLSRTAFSADDRAFVESRAFFFIATADANGWPDCSYKGGLPGFVRVLDERTLAFPSYDGNGMFRSLGNLLANAQVGLLFIDFEAPRRLRVLGTASVDAADPLLPEFAGAQHLVRVRADRIFPNCPRYIHRMQLVELSAYVPKAGTSPPVPAWKRFAAFRDVLPRGDPANASETPGDP